MSASTFAELKDDLATILGTGARSGDNLRTYFGRWLNRAFRRIAYAYPWESMRSRQSVQTAAPYATGTVAVTNASTALTFTGSTLVSGMAARKFTLAYGQPAYRISTVNTGAGTAVLSDAYTGSTASGASFVIFQDEYDLVATTHSVEEAILYDATGGTWPLVFANRIDADNVDSVGRSSGRPYFYTLAVSTTAGTPRVRFLNVPDNVYRAEFVYQKTWTDLSADADLYTTHGLPVDVEELALDRALRWAPRIEGTRRVMSDADWDKALRVTWAKHNPGAYEYRSRQGMNRPLSPRLYMNATGMAT